MEFENEPTDEQLDQLLQDVTIPQDLKSQLRQIPHQQKLDGSKPTPETSNTDTLGKSTPWMTYVLAASLIGIGLFVAYQFWPTTDGGLPMEKVANNEDPEKETGIQSAKLETGLAEFLQTQDQLEAAIHEVEVAQMQAQLAKLEQMTVHQLDQREVESVIAAMSEEYAIPLGVPEQQVRSKMAQVIEQYPGTHGAEIAHKFLNQPKF